VRELANEVGGREKILIVPLCALVLVGGEYSVIVGVTRDRAQAAEQAIVHRDLKSLNVLVSNPVHGEVGGG
jgi:hypothetical protein